MRKIASSAKTARRVALSPRARREVPAERLLDDDAGPVGAARRPEQPDDLVEQAGRDGQVMKRVLAPRRGRVRSALEGVGVVVGALDEAQLVLKLLDDRSVGDPVRLEALAGSVAQAVKVAMAGDADDRHAPAAIADETGQGGEDLLDGQVAGGAEEDQGVGVDRSRPAFRCGGATPRHAGQSRFSRWPPKPKRMAESTWSAKSASPRELKRSYSAEVRTGAGTATSMAAMLVQRPSPESETRPRSRPGRGCVEAPARSGRATRRR